MSGTYNLDVAGSMQNLVWLATQTRPDEDKSKPFTPQCASWQHKILSSYTEQDNTGDAIGSTLQQLIAYTVPANSALIICHVAIQTQPDANQDANLGATPMNYGDFRSNYSINPYGDFGIVGGAYPQLQILNQSGETITPLVPSFAMQGQSVLIPVQAGQMARLMANFAFNSAANSLVTFATMWCWLVPPQVASRLQDFKTSWFVQA